MVKGFIGLIGLIALCGLGFRDEKELRIYNVHVGFTGSRKGVHGDLPRFRV